MISTVDINENILMTLYPTNDASEKGKAPGQDGFTTDFFRSYCPMLREEVWKLVEESRNLGKFLLALNATFLTLLPK
jgi:hypothetical protein